METIRIRFSKTGPAKFISHLDLMRAFARALRRARLSVWYTEGFHPHPYLHFASPLPLGMEGLCECLDVKTEAPVSFERFRESLADVMTEHIRVTDVCAPVWKPSQIAFADYELTFDDCPAELGMAFLHRDEIVIAKKNKQVDIKQDIHSFAVADGFWRMILPASPVKNVNPSQIAAVFCAENGLSLPNITRKQLLTETGESFH